MWKLKYWATREKYHVLWQAVNSDGSLEDVELWFPREDDCARGEDGDERAEAMRTCEEGATVATCSCVVGGVEVVTGCDSPVARKAKGQQEREGSGAADCGRWCGGSDTEKCVVALGGGVLGGETQQGTCGFG